jgi:hypothetical protein
MRASCERISISPVRRIQHLGCTGRTHDQISRDQNFMLFTEVTLQNPEFPINRFRIEDFHSSQGNPIHSGIRRQPARQGLEECFDTLPLAFQN